MRVLGISCYYHDAAACLVEDGEIVAAAQEERFTRVKHDESFPVHAIRYCLAEGGGTDRGHRIDRVVFYDKPLLKFHRILETHLAVAPRGLAPYLRALPIWLKEKLWIPPRIEEALEEHGISAPEPILFTAHHEAHAASAFYPSPFEEAAVLTLDGVGEWATTTVGVGEGTRLDLLQQIDFPHSLGLLYSAFTYFCGFRVSSGEYKLMGLAPYGEPRYAERIREHLIDLRPDGSFRLNMDYFGYLDRLVMTNERFADLFGGPPRSPETAIGRREVDLARSIQEVTEEAVLKLAAHARELTGKRHLCLAGGVALNCVANGKLLRSGLFDDLWIQPAAGDAGGALGAALAVSYQGSDGDGPRRRHLAVPGRSGSPSAPAGDASLRPDAMGGTLLGPEFSAGQIREYLEAEAIPYEEPSEEAWAATVAELVAQGNVVGLFQGRMEFGPRALGCRSILGDPCSPAMQSRINRKIKFRESFRPFAPAVLGERVGEYFELDRPSPYMLLVADVREARRLPEEAEAAEATPDILARVRRARSDIPAVTHVDYSARVQTVHREINPPFWSILRELERRTGHGLVVNTSFNVRGEPIVCTPSDAYRCFMRTQMDHLVLGPFLLHKDAQPAWPDEDDWRADFPLD